MIREEFLSNGPARGRRRRIAAAVLSVVLVLGTWAAFAGSAQAASGGSAQAASGEVGILGGSPQGTCPSGVTPEVSEIDIYQNPDATHLDGGFYANIGSYWPPFTQRLCATVYQPSHGFSRPWVGTCESGRLPFWIPSFIPSTFDGELVVEWGLYLPPGWYEPGGGGPSNGIVLCWSPHHF